MVSASDQDSEQPIADQRKNFRAPLIIQKVHTGSDKPVFFGYSKNISHSGIFIATTNASKPGHQINLNIPLPAPLNITINCNCEVVWTRPLGKRLPFEPGMGLKFIDMPEDIKEKLAEWIEAQS